MSEEFKTTIIQANEAIWNEGKIELLDDYYAQDYVRHQPPFPDVEGLDALKAFVTDVRNAYPDFHITFHEIIAEGDTLAARWTWTGTHTGQGKLLPVPPTGKKVSLTGTTIAHNVAGKTVEEWENQDWLGFMQQLGLVPPLGG